MSGRVKTGHCSDGASPAKKSRKIGNKIDKSSKFILQLARGKHEVAYLKLPGYPARGSCKMAKSIRLFDLIGKYRGPDVILDFAEDGVLVGIELLAE